MEISDPLLRQARELAAREGVTLRTLVERGLRHVVTQKEREASFKLRRASFKGQGQQPELPESSWETMRDLIYGDSGARSPSIRSFWSLPEAKLRHFPARIADAAQIT